MEHHKEDIMKNGIDFVYEYSDLNLFYIRTQILTGKYAGIILEFGSSMLAQCEADNYFKFDYILYEVPDQFYGPRLRTDGEFNEFLAYLLVDIIDHKNKDPKEHYKLMQAASARGALPNSIKIDPKFYSKQATVI